MGLDMYAYSVDLKDALSDTEIAVDENSYSKKSELFYWRKHHDLHGWMNNLYRSRGGIDDFNCIKVRIYPEDLDALEADINESKLPNTSGFFFGNNPPDQDSIDYDMEFITKAREEIADGFAVYYDSWW